MTWDFFKRLRDTTKMKIVIEGISRAKLAKHVLSKVNGIKNRYVKNPGPLVPA